METGTVPRSRPKCPILSMSVPKFEVDSYEENGPETNLWCENEKVMDFHLKGNWEESGNDGEFIESTPIRRIEDGKEKLDQKDFNLCLEESSYIKSETRTLKNEVREPQTIKKETNDVNEVAAEELNYSLNTNFKSEFIEQEEVYIKHEEDIEDSLNKKIPKPTVVLHHCLECSYSTNHKGHLKSHSMIHKKRDEIDWYMCQECSFKTCRKNDLRRHVDIHSNLMLKCSKCSYATVRPTYFKRHQQKHKTDIQWLHCPECSYKTHLQLYLQRHSLKHKSKAFKCMKCSYQSRTKRQLTVHQVKHESTDKWHSCPLCHFKIHDKKLLKAHCLASHSINPNDLKQIGILKCTKCSYESFCKTKMKNHQLIHDQNSWLQCSLCDYKNPYKGNLKKHRVRHHNENGEGWYRCMECPFKNPDRYVLRYHVLSHKSADEIQWFECSQCNYKTAHKNNLTRHQLKHKEAHEVEWFSCYECGFATKHKSNLVSHILKHEREIEKSY